MQVTDLPEILTVKIEKLSNLGLGIAKFNGFVIFVENSCPGDLLKVKLTKINKNFATASVLEILEPSPHRVEPFCKMQKVCGSCQLQHIDYKAQLEYKKQIVEDAMRSICGADIEVKEVIPSPKITNYRYKIQYPISETKESKRILAGYYKPSSHELINIKYCPIQPEYCDEIIEFIRVEAKNCGVSGYDEKAHRGLLRHVVIRMSAQTNKCIVVLVANTEVLNEQLKNLAKHIYSELENIEGVCVNFNSKKTNLILGKETVCVEGKDYVEEALCDRIFKVGVNTFFQVNPATADNIFRFIKNYIVENVPNPSVLDAYAGISTFGICLCDVASSVVTIEEVPASVELAKEIIKENNIKNVEPNCGDAGKFLKDLAKEGLKFDISVIDPPRKGCSEESLDSVYKLTGKKIIYVSCNPATLARDLKYLREKGAKVEYIQPFDMFPHTYHIENVAIIDLQ